MLVGAVEDPGRAERDAVPEGLGGERGRDLGGLGLGRGRSWPMCRARIVAPVTSPRDSVTLRPATDSVVTTIRS